jgi:hypothetical protein
LQGVQIIADVQAPLGFSGIAAAVEMIAEADDKHEKNRIDSKQDDTRRQTNHHKFFDCKHDVPLVVSPSAARDRVLIGPSGRALRSLGRER